MDVNTAVVADRWSARQLMPPFLVFMVTTAVMAVPYWSAGYDTVRADGIFEYWLLVEAVLLVGTFVAGVASDAHLGLVCFCMLASTPFAVMGRVVIDTSADPTSHNLWPLEVVFSWFMGIPAVAVGGFLAWVVRRLITR